MSASPSSPRLELARRTAGPALGSAVVGLVLAVVTVVGVAHFSGVDAVPVEPGVPAADAVLGGPEYGSRG